VIVVDASAVIDLVLAKPASGDILERICARDSQALAPELIEVEVLHVLRRLVLGDELPADRAALAIGYFHDLPIRTMGHRMLARRIWELKHQLSAYDGAYVALAEALDAPLLTSDRRLAASQGHHARIELLA
jgi:predicted nucleic acid-binding protein